jgi:hypothetical protein
LKEPSDPENKSGNYISGKGIDKAWIVHEEYMNENIG